MVAARRMAPTGIVATDGTAKLSVESCFYSAQPKPAASMLTVFSYLSLFLVSLSTPPASAQVKHWNMGARDRVAECVGRILKRKVLIYAGTSVDASVCEVETAEGVLKHLEEKGLKVISNDQWTMISDGLPNTGKIIVVPRLTAPALTKDEQDRLQAALMQQSRFIPAEYAIDRETDGSQTIDILLHYAVTVMPGGARGALRMVVLLRQSDRNRIIFTEMHDGEFEVKWDSGELDADSVGIEFDDVDGDGKQEIVAMGERPVDYGSPNNDVLAVFDVEGRELTRQEKCLIYEYTALKRDEEMVCPIEGADISFITGTIPWEIEVSQSETSGHAKSTIYILTKEKGRYVAIVSPRAKSARKSTKP